MSPSDLVSSHTISVLVDNEPGILARVVGLFSGRGYNIESLTVAETDAKENLSRITIVTKGTPMIIEQIKAQLDRLVPVHRVRDLTVEGPHIERELALVKVKGTGEKRVEALRLADVFRAKVIDAKTDSFVFEVTGTSDKVQTFVGLMEGLGLVDVGRTGIVAFPNFAHWPNRISIARGRMPVTRRLPYQWYDTPNIHLCSIDDFRALCRDMGVRIERAIVLDRASKPISLPPLLVNLLGEQAVFMLRRD